MNTNENRLLYIDNLKLLIIILVVMVHLAVTYSGIGDWYYDDPGEIDTIQGIIFLLFQSFTQAYFMGILFLIAGYFVPISYDKKGFNKFMKERFIRLGLPTLLFMLIIDPFITAFLMNRPLVDGDGFLIVLKYIVSLQFIGHSGPLWFTFALLLFSIVYAFIRKFSKYKTEKSHKNPLTKPKIFVLILLISVCTFLVRIVFPIGTSISNMQLCYFSQYILLFIVGIKARRNHWLEKIGYTSWKVWISLGIIIGLISWIAIVYFGGALSGNLDVFYGGVSWQSAAYALWESFIAVFVSIGLISLFKNKLNKQNNLIRNMADNSFSVYVIHAPLIIMLAIIFAPVDLAPIIKFIITVIIGIPMCFLFSNFIIKKIPFFRKFGM